MTGWIERRANALLADGNRGVRRVALARASGASLVTTRDYVTPYVEDLGQAVDLDAVRGAGLRLGCDPLGGASAHYWGPIAARWGIDVTVVNPVVDPTFGFMPLDHDGRIRMDCSSPFAMANLVAMKDRFDLAFGNDADSDRHGIVVPREGLLAPNHFLAVAIDYLFRHRASWPARAGVGKTLVSSAHHRSRGAPPRAAARGGAGRLQVVRAGVARRELGFGGEESAGASFLRRDGSAWTTDKDGIVMDLLAAEMPAVTGGTPGELYAGLSAEFGAPAYARIDAPATPAEKAVLKRLSPEAVTATTLAGEPIRRGSPERRATAPRSAGSRWWRTTAGSRRARPAPRTSTRSTPRASGGRSTSPASSRRPGRS